MSSSDTSIPMRRIRPVERQPMREWLTNLLDNNEVASLTWLNKSKGEFSIKWCHGSRHGWSLKDADLFERWAKHTGRYLFGGKTDPKRWKANFRCALNSLRTVEEIRDKSVAKGSNAARIYRMKPTPTTMTKKEPKTNGDTHKAQRTWQRNTFRALPLKKETSESEDCLSSGSEPMEEDEVVIELKTEYPAQISTTEYPAQIPTTDYSQIKPNVTNLLPKFDKISPGIDTFEFGKKHCLPRHSSGFTVMQDTSQPPIQSDWKYANVKVTLPEIIQRQFLESLNSQSIIRQENRPIVFPESPEASSGSPASLAQEEMVELGVYEISEVSEEVVISSTNTDNTATTLMALDQWHPENEASTALANLITAENTQNSSSYVNNWMHGYIPLTPP